MGRSPCCSKKGLNRGAWTKQEDMILSEYIRTHGDGGWKNLPRKAGLNRCGKSCRLRWLNYLRPDIKRGNITSDEEDLIIRLHRLLGNRWSLIAGRLPGRTDNEIKNYWNTQLCKKLQLRNQSQCKSSKQNLETRSKNPSPIQNHVLKTTPINITRAVKHSEIASPANGCSNIENSTFKLCNAARETTNFSKSCCEQLVNDTIRYPDSEPVAFAMADVNLLEAAEVRNSACFMASTLEDEESPHNSDHFAEDTATLAESLLDMNELSSPRCKLLSSPSACSTGFEFEEFFGGAATETNEFQDMCCDRIKNMQRVNSFTVTEDQVIMEEPYDNTHENWVYELDY